MSRITLTALIGATLWTAAFTPLQAQVTRVPDPPTPPAPKVKLEGDDPIVASVNDKPIHWKEVIARLKADSPEALPQAVAQIMGNEIGESLFGEHPKASVTYTKDDVLKMLRDKPTQPIVQTLQQMIQQSVFEQELAKQGARITDGQIDDYINRLLKQARANHVIPDNMTDDDFLKSRGLTRATLRNRLRSQVEGMYLVQKDMEKQAGHPITAADFVQARHILIRVNDQDPSTKPEDKKKLDADALKRIQDIEADIKANKVTFEDAAKKNSDDGSKDSGGDLGVFMRGQMVPEFEKSAFTLKSGEMGEPVRSQFGYHLIRVDKAGKDLPQDEIDKTLDNAKQRKFNDYAATLLSQYKVVNNLSMPAPMGMGMNGGPGVRPGPRPNGAGGVRVTPNPTPVHVPTPTRDPKPDTKPDTKPGSGK